MPDNQKEKKLSSREGQDHQDQGNQYQTGQGHHPGDGHLLDGEDGGSRRHEVFIILKKISCEWNDPWRF